MSQSYSKYLIRPMQHALDISSPALNQPFTNASWGAEDFKIDQNSVTKRQGYNLDRSLGVGVDIQRILYYRDASNTEYTVFLTDTNAIVRKNGSSETWQYITQSETYTDDVDSINGGDMTTVSFDAAQPETDSVAAGDFFILDDDYNTNKEPSGHDNDAEWVEISAADDTGKTVTLVSGYPGTTGSWNGSEKTGYCRRVYSVPDNERWSTAMVQDASNNNLLIFTNGDVPVQYWNGSGFADDLDATNALKARYCLEFVDRLFLADFYVSTTRYPYSLKWSKNGDPTDWTDSTAGTADILETEDVIMGLGRVGSDMVIYKEDSLWFAHATGDSTSPISISRNRRGIGTPAPYSIIHALGSNAFLGRDDFYILDGDMPMAIGEKIRYKFFDLINPTEMKRVFGYYHPLQNEFRWLATDDDRNRWCFCFNIKYQEWYVYSHADKMSSGGKGEAD